MEDFVNGLLKDADLSVVTKKYVRQKYQDHLGRSLEADEKVHVNKLVYDFVEKLSKEQRKSTECSPDKESPGNKENLNGNKRKGAKYIIKGHVVDPHCLEKPKGKKTPEKSPRGRNTPKKSPKSPVDRSTLKQYPKRNRSPRLHFSDVMSAITASDHDDSGLEENEASEEEEEKEESLKDVSEKLQELKKAREKKIQMSQEKKKNKSTIIKDKKCVRRICSDDEKEEEEEIEKSSVISSNSSTPHLSDVGTPQSSPEKIPITKSKRKRVLDSESDSEAEEKEAKRRKIELQVKTVRHLKSSEKKVPCVSDSDDSMDVPLAVKKKQMQKNDSYNKQEHHSDKDSDIDEKKSKSGSDHSDVGSDNEETPVKVSRPKHRQSIDSDEDDKPSELETAKDTRDGDDIDTDSDSDISEIREDTDSNIDTSKPDKRKKKTKSVAMETSDDDEPLSKIKSKVEKKSETAGSKQKAKSSDSDSKNEKFLKSLRKICQACGMFIRNDRELKDCNTDMDKIRRLKQLLQAAGMEGRPSMKKAAEVRLQKEAAELNSSNIISKESSRGKRKVASKYSRRVATPKKSSPKKAISNPFSGLKGIVDGDLSDSD